MAIFYKKNKLTSIILLGGITALAAYVTKFLLADDIDDIDDDKQNS